MRNLACIDDGLDEHHIILDVVSITKDRQGAELRAAWGVIHDVLGPLEAAGTGVGLEGLHKALVAFLITDTEGDLQQQYQTSGVSSKYILGVTWTGF